MTKGHAPGKLESGGSTWDQEDAPDSREPSGDNRWNARLGQALVLSLIAIVVLPIVSTFFVGELGRWQLATAWEHRLNGDMQAAIDTLDSALAHNPKHVECYLQRAEWNSQLGKPQEALRDYDKIYELVGNDPRLMSSRAMNYHQLGKKNEAIRDAEQIVAEAQGVRRIQALNMSAYIRALNDDDLEQALKEIDQSIDLSQNQGKLLSRITGISHIDPSLLDTRGFIRYKLGKLDAARSDLETAVGDFVKIVRVIQASHVQNLDPRVHRIKLQSAKATLAVLVYHRGLVYEKLGEKERAAADFSQVRELGHEPNDDLY